MAFLHGIEHLDLPADLVPVNDVVTAVIGLVGTSNAGETNVLTLCKSAKDDAQFGTEGTIPEALKAIRFQDSKRGSALVFVVKVEPKEEAAEITPADIIGEIAEDGTRTGMQLFATAASKYGFEPMIYIAPRYSALGAVKDELILISDKTETMAYIDTPDGFTYEDAIASRGTGTDAEFNTLTEGQKLLFPHFLVSNPAYIDAETTPDEDKYLNKPMSAYAAGLRAKVDLEEGWHVSSSNHRFTGVQGLDTDLTFSMGDPNSEANQLNAAGITTAVNLFGNGIVEWGNYTAGFPGSAAAETFECVRRTRAIMKRAVEQAAVPFLDKPFNQANIDAIRNMVNQYLNTLVSQGKLLAGQCFYLKESNPAVELAKGHITFDIEFTPAIPMQRLTFTYKINLSNLSNVE